MNYEASGWNLMDCVREVFESGVAMGRMALAALGESEDEIDQAEESYRLNDGQRFDAQREANDVKAARDLIITRPQRRRKVRT